MTMGIIGHQRKKGTRGVTLVELLIVVFMVGILAAIAVPLYTDYITRARRADAKTALEQVRAAQEMWRAERGGYSTNISQLQTTMGAPPNNVGYYTWSFTGALNANTFTARATPTGSQASDGYLEINHHGVKTSEKPDRWTK